MERRRLENNNLDNITLADVKAAIMILEEFMRQLYSVKSTLNRYYSLQERIGLTTGLRRPEDIIGLMLAQSLIQNAKTKEKLEEEEIEIDQEEIARAKERLRRIAERERKRYEMIELEES